MWVRAAPWTPAPGRARAPLSVLLRRKAFSLELEGCLPSGPGFAEALGVTVLKLTNATVDACSVLSGFAPAAARPEAHQLLMKAGGGRRHWLLLLRRRLVLVDMRAKHGAWLRFGWDPGGAGLMRGREQRSAAACA